MAGGANRLHSSVFLGGKRMRVMHHRKEKKNGRMEKEIVIWLQNEWANSEDCLGTRGEGQTEENDF